MSRTTNHTGERYDSILGAVRVCLMQTFQLQLLELRLNEVIQWNSSTFSFLVTVIKVFLWISLFTIHHSIFPFVMYHLLEFESNSVDRHGYL